MKLAIGEKGIQIFIALHCSVLRFDQIPFTSFIFFDLYLFSLSPSFSITIFVSKIELSGCRFLKIFKFCSAKDQFLNLTHDYLPQIEFWVGFNFSNMAHCDSVWRAVCARGRAHGVLNLQCNVYVYELGFIVLLLLLFMC